MHLFLAAAMDIAEEKQTHTIRKEAQALKNMSVPCVGGGAVCLKGKVRSHQETRLKCSGDAKHLTVP